LSHIFSAASPTVRISEHDKLALTGERFSRRVVPEGGGQPVERSEDRAVTQLPPLELVEAPLRVAGVAPARVEPVLGVAESAIIQN
jgi:hypothetical protein